MQPNIRFNPEDWERVERDTMAWWAGELDRPLVYLTGSDPVEKPPFSFLSNYPLDMPAEDVVDCCAAKITAAHYYADAFPWFWMNFGPGIAAGFLGANVHSVSDPSETVWFTPSEDRSIQDLDPSYDPENPWWLRVKAVTAAFVERFGSQVQISHTDLGGNLDILASLRTTEGLLFDCVEQPEAVVRQVKAVTDLWMRYYEELETIIKPTCRGSSCWTPIYSTGRTYMMQCDFSYMIGPKMFERYVVPDIAACCDFLDHGFYHLDGKGEIPHLDLLLGIERLRGIQWIPGDGQPSPDQWLPLLKRIRDGGKLCQLFVTPEGARRVVRELGGKGFLLVLNNADGFENPEVAQAFLKTLAQEDAGRK